MSNAISVECNLCGFKNVFDLNGSQKGYCICSQCNSTIMYSISLCRTSYFSFIESFDCINGKIHFPESAVIVDEGEEASLSQIHIAKSILRKLTGSSKGDFIMEQKELRTYRRRDVTRVSGYHTCDETTGGECLIIRSKKHLCTNAHEEFTFHRRSLDETATCLCSSHNSQKSDTFPVDYYTEDELVRLSQITGLSLDVLHSRSVNMPVLKLLIENVVWFYDEFLMDPDYQKVRDGILTANKINDSLKRIIAGKVDLAEEYRKRTGHYPTSVTTY